MYMLSKSGDHMEVEMSIVIGFYLLSYLERAALTTYLADLFNIRRVGLQLKKKTWKQQLQNAMLDRIRESRNRLPNSELRNLFYIYKNCKSMGTWEKLVFSCPIANYEKILIFVFQQLFASINQILFWIASTKICFGRKTGHRVIILWCFEIFLILPNFLRTLSGSTAPKDTRVYQVYY